MSLPSLICPNCAAAIEPQGNQVTCGSCGRSFRADTHWDFAPDLHYVDDETAPNEIEELGERLRAERFYLPLLRELAAETGRSLGELRLLDDGCGWGAGVERLREEGIEAVGIDVGWRSEAWASREPPWPYLRADGRAIPFPDATFDAIVSFGVIEHVGIEGESGASEEVAADYDDHRARYVAEALRVMRAPGVFVLSQPNGSCPVDFWHYPGSVPARLHNPRQPFLPRLGEIRRWVRRADPGAQVDAVSPRRLLAFERIRHWWYGRLFAGTMRALFAVMALPGLRVLARTPLNPFLVVVTKKRRD